MAATAHAGRHARVGALASLQMENGKSTVRLEVTHILEAESDVAYRAIVAVGGIMPEGARWLVSQADAVRGVEEGRWSFYVRGRGGRKIALVVACADDGTRYLKGPKDPVAPVTLLLLPKFNLSDMNLPSRINKQSA